jgi:hypothetical protein
MLRTCLIYFVSFSGEPSLISTKRRLCMGSSRCGRGRAVAPFVDPVIISDALALRLTVAA